MKTRQIILKTFAVATVLAAAAGCKGEEFDYQSPTLIEFSTPQIVQIAKGVTTYTITGRVTSTVGITEFCAYPADSRTGISTGIAIPGTHVVFGEDDARSSYDFSIPLTGIGANTCVKITVWDRKATFEKGFMVKITPGVLFTDQKTIETGDHLYGCYYATWYLGRVYPLREAVAYPAAVDLSFGVVTDTGTGITAPAAISPAARAGMGLNGYAGARITKVGPTDLTLDDYNAITEVDDTPLQGLAPTADYVVVGANQVYAYQTAEGKKGLFVIHSLVAGAEVATMQISAKVQN